MNHLFVSPGMEEIRGENREEMRPASCCIKAVRHDEHLDFADSAENGKSDRQENNRGEIIDGTQGAR